MKRIAILPSLILALLMATPALAEGGGEEKGGEGFLDAASQYEAKAKEYRSRGNEEIAGHYSRMAEIKTNAAKLADEGRWDEIDWTEYHALEKKIYKMKAGKYK